jgi:hypothetical protein
MAVSVDGEALYFKDPADQLLSLPKRDDFLDLERPLVCTGTRRSPGFRFFDFKQVRDGRIVLSTAQSSALNILSVDLNMIESVVGCAQPRLPPDLLPLVCFSATGTDENIALWNAGGNRLFVVDLNPKVNELEEVPLVLHKAAEVFLGLTAQSGRKVLVGYRVQRPASSCYYLSYWEKSERAQMALKLLQLKNLDARGRAA